MNNVVRLFDRDLEPERIMVAEKSLLAAGAELNHAVNAFSKRLDKIDNAIASIDDAESRSRLANTNKLSREQLFAAALQLTREIKKFVKKDDPIMKTSERYRLKALACEKFGREDPNPDLKLAWAEIGIEWHALATRTAPDLEQDREFENN
jgi:hypothetical protein